MLASLVACGRMAVRVAACVRMAVPGDGFVAPDSPGGVLGGHWRVRLRGAVTGAQGGEGAL
eukprot:1148616-Pelagomonas_calceolata.AAC.1